MKEWLHPIKWAIYGYLAGAIVSHIFPAAKAFWIGLILTVITAGIGG